MEIQEQNFEKLVLTNPEYLPNINSIIYSINAVAGGLFFSTIIESIIAIISIATNSFPISFLMLQYFGLMYFIGGSYGFAYGISLLRLKRDFWMDILFLKDELRIIGGKDSESKYINPNEIDGIKMGIYVTKSLAGKNKIQKTYHLKMQIKPKNQKQIILRTIINRRYKEVIEKDLKNFSQFIQTNYNIEPTEIEHIYRTKRLKLFFLSLIPLILTTGIILLLYYV